MSQRGRRSGELKRSLSVTQAIALAISIVIGSGLLVLPGLAYSASGRSAFYTWIIDGLLVVPLLGIYASLGARYPKAGGIASFVQAAFGRRMGAGTEVLVLGTFSLGIPGVALTGGRYLTYWLGGGTGLASAVAGLGLLALALAVNYPGVRVSGTVQQVLSFSLVIVLLLIGILGLVLPGRPVSSAVAPVSDWLPAVASIGSVFVAYTGWEMLSFTAEEYRNPRSIPLTIAVSFLIITVVYLFIALAIQRNLNVNDPNLATAPIAAVVSRLAGRVGGNSIALVGVVIIAANLIGSLWAASRLIFASAREGLLPSALRNVAPVSHVPRPALLTAVAIFTVVIVLTTAGLIPFQALFKLSGQSYFILYGLGVASYVRLARSRRARAFGVACIPVVLVTMVTFGVSVLYSAALMLLGFLLAGWRPRPEARAEEHSATA